MDQYTAEWQAWHDARVAELATPFGWLSVTGLIWLTDGEPATWENGPGTFVRNGDWVHFTVADGIMAGPGKDALETMSRPSAVAEVRIDSPTQMSARVAHGASVDWIVVESVMYELFNRGGWIGVRRHDSKSPLLSRFIDIPTFTPDLRWVVPATYIEFPDPMIRTVPTAAPGLEFDRSVTGEVRFEFEGHVHRLKTEGSRQTGLSIRFHDYTNGFTTATWRRLTTGLPDAAGTVILDFNRTVNDGFAFTPYATTPAPVPENILPLSVEAGERRPTQTMSEAGINTPVLLIETSSSTELGSIADDLDSLVEHFEDNGLDVTRVRPTAGEELPPLAGYEAVVLFGLDRGDQLTAEQRAEITEVLTDVMAVRLPVVAAGASAELLAQAASHESLTAGRMTFAGMPADLGRVPLAVSAEVADDSLFRKNISKLGSDGIGYIEISKLAGEAEAGSRAEAYTVTWRDMVERFARLVHTKH
ncbi:hypothetical protein GCM10022261_18510 [Brevibacterium daeguense]|uniref:Uncharacterized protein n=1 Tax=Brevibacterium daeguense TaxID=909936 RepID=A0ABP8EK88_9MICO